MDGYIVDTLPKGVKEIVIKNYLDSNSELVESYAVKDDRISAGSIFISKYLEQYGKARKKDVRVLLGYYGTAAEPPGRCGEPRNNQAPIRILQ